MEGITSDFRYAFRRLAASPTFTIAAILTLALAIGATASVFGLVDGVLLKPFAVRDPDQVFVIWESSPERQMTQFAVAPANYLDWQTQNSAFTDIAATTNRTATVMAAQGSDRVEGAAVTPGFFRVLGTTPALGRVLGPDDDDAEVVISYGYWQRNYGGEPSVLGQRIIVDDHPRTIVGVMPGGTPGSADLWMPLRLSNDDVTERGNHYLIVVGRAKPGVSRIGAQHNLETIAQRLANSFPATNQDWTVRLVPLMDQLTGRVRPALVMLLAAAACVLLVGVANLAGLFLVRGVARAPELAVRSALGATRSRLTRLLVIEATTLGLAAGVLGIGIAVTGVRILQTLAPANLPRLADVGVDARVASFCLVMTGATVLLFGVLPAYQISRNGLAGFLKEGHGATGSKRRVRLQDGLVVLQVLIGLVLVTGAVLFVNAFDHFRRLDAGFRPDGVLTAEIGLPDARYPTAERQAAFIVALVDRLVAQPEVDAASASSSLPGMGAGNWGFNIAGAPPRDPSHVPIANVSAVSSNYFRTLGIALRRGRPILPSDDRKGLKVVVIDELLASRFFPGRDPIGERLVPVHAQTDTLQIVGIVGSVKQSGLAAENRPELYVPFTQWPGHYAAVAVRASGAPQQQARAISRAVAELDRGVSVSGIQSMNDRMMQTVGLTRFSSFLASLFAVVALILGAVGTYGLLAHGVNQRRREIAVRLALGATPSDVVSVVVKRALALTVTGTALGFLVTWMSTPALSGILMGVTPHDPLAFAAAATIMIIVGLTAASVPAFRAARVNPATALRSS